MANSTGTISSSPKPTSSSLPTNGSYCPISTQFLPASELLPVPDDAVVCAVEVIAGTVPVLERCCNTTNITYLPWLSEGYDWCWAYCVYRIVNNTYDSIQANQDMLTCFEDAALAQNMSEGAFTGGLQCVWQPQNTTSASSMRHTAGGGVKSTTVWALLAGLILAAEFL